MQLGSSLENQRKELPAFTDITDAEGVGAYLYLQAPNGFPLQFVSGPADPHGTAAIEFGGNRSITPEVLASTPKTAAGIGIGIGSSKDDPLDGSSVLYHCLSRQGTSMSPRAIARAGGLPARAEHHVGRDGACALALLAHIMVG